MVPKSSIFFLLSLISILLIACGERELGNVKEITQEVKTYCSSLLIEQDKRGDKTLLIFKDKNSGENLGVFLRFDGYPTFHHVYLLYNFDPRNDKAEKAFSCAYNFLMAKFCHASLDDAFAGYRLALKANEYNRRYEKFDEFRKVGKCHVSFISRGDNGLSFLTF